MSAGELTGHAAPAGEGREDSADDEADERLPAALLRVSSGGVVLALQDADEEGSDADDEEGEVLVLGRQEGASALLDLRGRGRRSGLHRNKREHASRGRVAAGGAGEGRRGGIMWCRQGECGRPGAARKGRPRGEESIVRRKRCV